MEIGMGMNDIPVKKEDAIEGDAIVTPLGYIVRQSPHTKLWMISTSVYFNPHTAAPFLRDLVPYPSHKHPSIRILSPNEQHVPPTKGHSFHSERLGLQLAIQLLR